VPAWLTRVVARVRELATLRKVVFTQKAARELELIDLPIDQEDALEVLGHLSAEDFSARFMSDLSDEWMYVFKPRVGGLLLYVKVILRHECRVISLHEARGDDDEESEE
jgi:hypothetical protein